MRQCKLLLFCFVLFIGLPATGKDLGQQGKLYPIDEIDMRLLMARDLEQANIEAAQKKIVASADKYMDSLPLYDFPPTRHTLTRWIDPSIVVNEDISGPVKDSEGNWQWQVLHKKGTEVNPLEHTRPVTRMLFINSDSEAQLEFAIAAAKAYPYRIKIVLTSGNPTKLSERIMMPVFYSNPALNERFELRFTPTLAGVGEGEYENHLAVTEFSYPYHVENIEAAWFGLSTDVVN